MTDKTIIYTDGGSVSYRGNYYGGWGFSGKSGDKTFVGYGACKARNATNNHAEMEAYVQACEYVLKHKFNDVLFKLDSQYVLKGANTYLPRWEESGWLTKQGLPVKNKQMWINIKNVRAKLKEANIKHEYEWVKGHRGDVGNELADKGATKGIALSRAGSYKPVYSYEDEVTITTVKKVKVDVPKMLCLKRLICVTGSELPYREKTEHFVYYQSNWDDKKNVRSKYCGRAGTDVIEGLHFTKTKVGAIHTVYDALSKAVGKGTLIPGVLQLDKILSKANLASITARGKDVIEYIGDDVMLSGDALLAYPIKVPLMSLCAFNSLNYKFTLVECYLDGLLKDEHVFDMTDMFTITDKTGVKFNKAIAKETAFKVSFKLEQGVAHAALIPNVNFPQLVKLAGLFREEEDVKVKVILHNVSNLTFQYSFIVETGSGDVSIFDSPSSNLRLFKR